MLEAKGTFKRNLLQENEIDLILKVKLIWNGRRRIIKITIILIFIGLFVAVFSEKEYTASTTIVPQTSGRGKSLKGSLGGLAAIAGVDLGSLTDNDSEISPLLYPRIISSTLFQKELLNTSLTIKGYDDPVTFQEYYREIYKPSLLGAIKKYTIGLPGIIIKKIKSTKTSMKSANSQIITITDEEQNLIERLENQISLSVNRKEGYISISSTMPEALNSAELTENIQKLLQKYIINFNVKKSKDELRYITERYKEKEKIYKETQNKLAVFQDRNQFMNTALAQNTLIRYQADYDLAFDVYSELAKEQERQQLKVKEDTPVFTILDSVSIPNKKSKPQRAIIVFIFSFLGFILGVTIVLTEANFKNLRKKLKDK
jgi:LPS O-antigen subunit length determinant protein (WzzB/FepE family)